MNLQEQLHKIKKMMGVLNESNIEAHLKHILVKRIPFLKEYNIFDHPRDPHRLEAQRVVFNKDVKVFMKDEMVTFPQFNVSSEVYYYPHKIDTNTFHHFGIKNSLYPMPPHDMDELTQKIIFLATNQLSERMSYREEIIVKDGEEFPQEKLDEIINDMNGCLFKIEEYTQEHRIDLF